MNKTIIIILLATLTLIQVVAAEAEYINLTLNQPYNYKNREITVLNIGSRGSALLKINDIEKKLSLNNPIKVYGLEITLKSSTELQIGIEIDLLKDCILNSECNDGNVCTIDKCEENKCSYAQQDGCSLNNECKPIETVVSVDGILSYCKNNEWTKQKSLNEECENNYECLSNTCDGVCKSLITTQTTKEINFKTYFIIPIILIIIVISYVAIKKWKRNY